MIRIGVINTCIHAYLYGSCFGPYERYQLLLGGGQLDIIESSSVPVIPFKNTCVAAVWDPDKTKAEQYGRAFGCQVVDQMLDLADVSDAIFLANTSGPGEDHLDIALPFLEKGLPVNVDKPLADTLDKAKLLIQAAERTGTLVYSSSLLQYVKATEELKKLDLGDVRTAIATGGGSLDKIVGAIHAFSALNGFMGPGIHSAYFLNSAANGPGEMVRFLYEDGRVGIIQMNGVPAEFRVDVFGTKGIAWRETPMPQYRYGAIGMARAFVDMVAAEEKKPALSYAHMLEIVAALTAAQVSKAEGREVALSELL